MKTWNNWQHILVVKRSHLWTNSRCHPKFSMICAFKRFHTSCLGVKLAEVQFFICFLRVFAWKNGNWPSTWKKMLGRRWFPFGAKGLIFRGRLLSVPGRVFLFSTLKALRSWKSTWRMQNFRPVFWTANESWWHWKLEEKKHHFHINLVNNSIFWVGFFLEFRSFYSFEWSLNTAGGVTLQRDQRLAGHMGSIEVMGCDGLLVECFTTFLSWEQFQSPWRW